MSGVFQFNGMSLASFKNGQYGSPNLNASLDELAATNADWISINVERFTSTITSADIHATGSSESDANVTNAIAQAHARGLSVMLKPMVDSLDGTWRGEYAPADVPTWFANYKATLVSYAKLAQANDVEMLCIGTEYKSLTGAAYKSYWTDLIGAVRAVYDGPLVYAADWSEAKDVSFWDKVDYIGVDPYVPLTEKNNPTVAELKAGWTSVSTNPWVAAQSNYQSPVDFYHSLSTQYGKPVIFPEIGYRSIDGANKLPGNWSQNAPVDLQEQADAYQAFFEVWSQQTSWMKGAFLWNWEPRINPQTTQGWDGYTPQDKPAETVITEWYGGTATAPTPPPPPAPELWVEGGATINWLARAADGATVNGTAGNDFFGGGAGRITMVGGVGDDKYIVNHSYDVIAENAGGGVDTASVWATSFVLAANVENLVLEGSWGQSGTGNALANIMRSGAGGDTLDGAGGSDLLVGGGGRDKFLVKAGNGSDTIADFQNAVDVVTLDGFALGSFAAVRAAMTQAGSDVKLALGGGDVLTFRGHAIADFSAADFTFARVASPAPTPAPAPAPAPAPTPTPTAPAPGLSDWAQSGAPTKWYARAADGASVTGTAGNDFFGGGAGRITMIGNGGDDTYIVNHSYDVITENAGGGVDTAESWSTSYVLAANVENLVLKGNWGQTGTGNGGDNRLVSTAGKDTLNGGGGDDALVAGTGASKLTGGSGSDLFVFSKASAHDNVVTDFVSGGDALDFRPLMTALGYRGTDPVADHVLGMRQAGADVVVTIDADGSGGGSGHTLVTIQNAQLSQLKDGVDYLWH
jgi:Ca2+-binding RTX toxin-like protein